MYIFAAWPSELKLLKILYSKNTSVRQMLQGLPFHHYWSIINYKLYRIIGKRQILVRAMDSALFPL